MNIISTIKKIWKSFAEHAWILHVCKRIRSSRYFGEMAEMDAQNLQDKIRKFFAKHAWNFHVCKRLWARFFVNRYGKMAEVSAADLQKICEYVNPSYLSFLACVRNAATYHGVKLPASLFSIPTTPEMTQRSLLASEMVYWFYHQPQEFIDNLNTILSNQLDSGWSSVAYTLEKIYHESFSPSSDGFKKIIGDRLKGHVVWRGKTIRFKRIKIKGDVKLALGGRFNRWLFNRVQFCDDAAINIYPPREDTVGKMVFTNNICCGKFSCSFAAVPRIHIGGNIFHFSLDMGADANISQNHDSLGRWIEEMTRLVQIYSISIVKFSNNYVGGFATIYNVLPTSGGCNHVSVLFLEGNFLGGLSVPALSPEQQDKRPTEGDVKHSQSMRFDIHEHIKMPSNREMAMRYKDYFVFLKDKAIKANDREAEFNYGRKERYFDRGITTRRQDKFILWWSHLVSNSGVSWLRPAAILLVGQWILAAIFIGGFGGCDGWLIATVESLNPLSSLDDIAKSPCCKEWIDSFSASVYNAVRRIFSLALLYEIIKVLRRFSN